jgi:colanic acid/amylovoran biosynthesis glycosyltransferase
VSTRVALPTERASEQRLPLRVAYVISRFPKLTETFILFEMLSLQKQGVQIEVHPLLRARNTSTHPEGRGLPAKLFELFRKPNASAVTHPEVAQLAGCVHFRPLLSWEVTLANLRAAVTRPQRYFGALAALIRSTLGSANLLLGGLSVFPKTVATALDLERRSIDHVHAHFANHPAAAAFVIHRLSGIPYSFTAHGADFQVDQHMLCEKVRGSAFVVTVSDYNRRFILEHCGDECDRKVVVIRCGVDRSVFTREGAAEPSPRREELRLLCIGTMYEVKGHRYLLDACRRLADSEVPFVCRLIGDGPDRAALETRAEELGIGHQVEFVGRCTRSEVARAIRQADVVVVPSVPTQEGRREGIPVVCMEGMAGGAAVVASRISGIPELVKDGVDGLLVPPRDVTALAEALARLHRDPELRRRLAEAGRRRVAQDYDLDRSTAHLLARIQEVHQ